MNPSLTFQLFFFLLTSFLMLSGPANAETDYYEPIDSRLRSRPDAVELAVDQLLRTQFDSGFFPYDFNFTNGEYTSMEDISGVNLVRQTGAIFSVANVIEQNRNEEIEQAIGRFLAMTAQESIPISKGFIQGLLESSGLYNRWQIWKPLRKPLYKAGLLFTDEGPSLLVTTGKDYERAYPGATALTLIAAIKYRNTTGDHQFDAEIIHWKDGLLELMVDGRGFREAPHYLSESEYVNGEAWLALAQYINSFPDDAETRSVIYELEDYYFNEYSLRPRIRFYSWGMMAINARYNTSHDVRYINFAREMTEWFFSAEENYAHPDFNSCALIEGVATFVNLMHMSGQPPDELTGSAQNYVDQEIAHIKQLQIDDNFLTRLNLDEKYHSEASQFIGGFILSKESPLMQVDLTGHCINALLLSNN